MALKDQLEAAGYDTQGLDESALISKLDSAGYDTSSLKPVSDEVQKQRELISSLTAQNIDPAVIKVQQTKLHYMENGKELPAELKPTGEAFDTWGQRIAESAATIKGVPPQLAAAAGTAFAMIPKTAEAAMALPIAEEAAGSTIVKALTPGAKAALGEQIGAAEAEKGVKQIIPTVSNMAKRFELPSGERGFSDIVNSVKQKLEAGEKLNPQDLVDFRDLVKTRMGIKGGPTQLVSGTKAYALASKTNKMAGELLNELVPKRAAPAAQYAEVAKMQKALKTLAMAGAGASGVGLSAAILRKLASM